MLTLILAVMLWLSPGHVTTLIQERELLAKATELATTYQEPLFSDDDALQTKSLSLVLAIEFYESGFKARAVGDCPGKKAGDGACKVEQATSFCAMQLNGERFRGAEGDTFYCVSMKARR